MPELATKLKMYRFDQMAAQVKDKVLPADADVNRYVGLEHIDPESLKIRRWGEPSDVESSKILFRSDDIIFGKRRAYQRKLAVADFDGICSAHAMVLRPKTDVVLREFLPFFMQTDEFMERAVKISVGGLSPTINWKDLAKEEFALPPLAEQRRALEVLLTIRQAEESIWEARSTAAVLRKALLESLVEQAAEWDSIPIGQLCRSDSPLCYGVVQPGNDDPSGVPLLRVCDIEQPLIRIAELKRVSKDLDRTYRRSRIECGDVLVSVVGTIGRIFRVTEAESGFNIARAIARIRTDKCDPDYLAVYLQSPQIQRTLIGEAFESARKTLNLEALAQIKVPIPATETQVEWHARLGHTNQSLRAFTHRLDDIRQLRGQIVAQAFE